MAQASVDLPDPKHRPSSSSPVVPNRTNVDDLLAQLAGEEIDRLLAEAENGRTPGSDDSPQAEPPTAAPSPVRVTQPAIELPTKASSVDAAMSAQLDNLYDQLESQAAPEPVAVTPAVAPEKRSAPTVPPTPVAGAAPAPTARAADDAPPMVERSDAVPSVSFAATGELATSPVERVALELDLPEPSPAEVALEEPTRLVRFLELLNSPLIAAPEALRALVGKIALVTLFNAVAVLIYVLIFRRHHS